ncbi:N-acylglucosamine 2-epimerase [Pseudomonas chlororaphis subsp. aurantiaca]|nr:N-acylglucosamine 2-epimerase [Pseudomonas chlororaphis subsp. aurantiaca]
MNPIPLTFSSWLNAPAHHQWLAAEGQRLLTFARAARLPEGFGDLDEHGRLPSDARAGTMNTARMTHSFAMAHIQGIPGYAALVDHGIAALNGALRDGEYGGWFATPGHADGNSGKAAYLHAFVALAASSAVVAARPGAEALLAEAIRVIERHFWSEEEGAMRESFNRDWSGEEAYRGANSNMHATEAFLALADVTQDPRWLNRALHIVERVIHQHSAAGDYRVIEHFDRQWQPLPDYNQEHPADGFRPYGTTPGTLSSGPVCCCTSKPRVARPACSAPAGCCWMPRSCSKPPAVTPGTSMARRALSTPWTGSSAPWCASACTGPTPKPRRRPAPCCSAPATCSTKPGIGASGSSPPSTSSIHCTAAGTTSWTAAIALAPRSGPASRTCITPGRRC